MLRQNSTLNVIGAIIVSLTLAGCGSRPLPDVPMSRIPAGAFVMGSDAGEPDEAPVHAVYLDEYYIDQYEVTNAQYQNCANARACTPPHRQDRSCGPATLAIPPMQTSP